MNNTAINKTSGIDVFLSQRQEFIDRVQPLLTKGTDFYEIKDRKSLGKPGAEKIASIFGWTATFNRDTDTLEMLGNKPGLVAYVCNLTKGEVLIGQGRGAANLDKNYGDSNKTIKMAQKSAFIDAVIRSSGLSDIFTQDLEDMNVSQIGNNATTGRTTPQDDFTKSVTQILDEMPPGEDPDFIVDGDNATEDQLKEIVREVQNNDISDSEIKSFVIAHFGKQSIKDLNKGQAKDVLAWVKR